MSMVTARKHTHHLLRRSLGGVVEKFLIGTRHYVDNILTSALAALASILELSRSLGKSDQGTIPTHKFSGKRGKNPRSNSFPQDICGQIFWDEYHEEKRRETKGMSLCLATRKAHPDARVWFVNDTPWPTSPRGLHGVFAVLYVGSKGGTILVWAKQSLPKSGALTVRHCVYTWKQ